MSCESIIERRLMWLLVLVRGSLAGSHGSKHYYSVQYIQRKNHWTAIVIPLHFDSHDYTSTGTADDGAVPVKIGDRRMQMWLQAVSALGFHKRT